MSSTKLVLVSSVEFSGINYVTILCCHRHSFITLDRNCATVKQ